MYWISNRAVTAKMTFHIDRTAGSRIIVNGRDVDAGLTKAHEVARGAMLCNVQSLEADVNRIRGEWRDEGEWYVHSYAEGTNN